MQKKNSPTLNRDFNSFGNVEFNVENEAQRNNNRVPTASFNRGSGAELPRDRRIAVSVPPRLQLSNSGKHQDLHCPFGFESQLELRLSQKKLKRKKQEEKAQRRRLHFAINSELSENQGMDVGKPVFGDLSLDREGEPPKADVEKGESIVNIEDAVTSQI